MADFIDSGLNSITMPTSKIHIHVDSGAMETGDDNSERV